MKKNKLDIEKHKEILVKMIRERMRILDIMNTHLQESIEYTDLEDNKRMFYETCNKNRVKIDDKVEGILAQIYSVNIALKCLRVGLNCKTWTTAISYNRIAKFDSNADVAGHHITQVCCKIGLIEVARKEVRMIQQWIGTNVRKYENIIADAKDTDIYSLDRKCADIDRAIGYIRKVISIISNIVEKYLKKKTGSQIKYVGMY